MSRTAGENACYVGPEVLGNAHLAVHQLLHVDGRELALSQRHHEGGENAWRELVGLLNARRAVRASKAARYQSSVLEVTFLRYRFSRGN